MEALFFRWTESAWKHYCLQALWSLLPFQIVTALWAHSSEKHRLENTVCYSLGKSSKNEAEKTEHADDHCEAIKKKKTENREGWLCQGGFVRGGLGLTRKRENAKEQHGSFGKLFGQKTCFFPPRPPTKKMSLGEAQVEILTQKSLTFFCPFFSLCSSVGYIPFISAFCWAEGRLASKFLRFMFFFLFSELVLTSLSWNRK